MASQPKDLAIPLIDISPLSSPSASTRLTCSTSILHAFQTHGFLYLSSHPISPPTISSVFSNSAHFFARPQAQKDALAWTTPRANRGYVAHGREKVSHGRTVEEVLKDRANNPDLKESLEIGREGEPGMPNRWPQEVVGEEEFEAREFRDTMRDFFGQCKDLHRTVMRALALGLGLDEGFFDGFVKVGDNTLRLLHYPPVSSEVFRRNKGQVRAGAHTDYGSITLLFQDQRGGLQVQTEGAEWKDVTPIPGTVVVNAGDLLARWSNDSIRSTTHRVVEPPPKEGGEEAEEYPARYSVAYFCNPDFETEIEVLPGTFGEDKVKKYESINSGEYLVQRLQATY
ncbi:MAG: hypothetical protein MMC23_005505 [Stictis urceolatum]|nr:hypothetical protein [Stictis urceolata]